MTSIKKDIKTIILVQILQSCSFRMTIMKLYHTNVNKVEFLFTKCSIICHSERSEESCATCDLEQRGHKNFNSCIDSSIVPHSE